MPITLGIPAPGKSGDYERGNGDPMENPRPKCYNSGQVHTSGLWQERRLMGLFGKKKDWNVIAIMFETKEQYRVNGNRARGSNAASVRDAAKNHDRTIFWAAFDQKRAFLEGGPGKGHNHVPAETLDRLERDLLKIDTVRSILSVLEEGKIDKAAKALRWSGYPSAKHAE